MLFFSLLFCIWKSFSMCQFFRSIWSLQFLRKTLVTCCAFVTLGRGRDSSCDPLRRTECQNTVVAQEESTKFGVGSLFLVAKDCSKVKRTYNSGGRWTEYLPSLEGIQEDFRIRGQRSKGRGGVSVTQLFLKTERKKELDGNAESHTLYPTEAFFRLVEWNKCTVIFKASDHLRLNRSTNWR